MNRGRLPRRVKDGLRHGLKGPRLKLLRRFYLRAMRALADQAGFEEDRCDICGAHVGWGHPMLHLRRCDDHVMVKPS